MNKLNLKKFLLEINQPQKYLADLFETDTTRISRIINGKYDLPYQWHKILIEKHPEIDFNKYVISSYDDSGPEVSMAKESSYGMSAMDKLMEGMSALQESLMKLLSAHEVLIRSQAKAVDNASDLIQTQVKLVDINDRISRDYVSLSNRMMGLLPNGNG